MKQSWTLIITVVTAAAVPVSVWLIRMARGETRNDFEAIIALAILNFYDKYKNGLVRP